MIVYISRMPDVNKYWDRREDELMLILFNTGTTRKDYSFAYEEILPKLRYMAKQILHRYYNCPENRVNELVNDAINHLLVYSNYDSSRKTKIYSYTGTILKRYFFDVFVNQVKYNYKKNAIYSVDNNYDITDSESEWVIDRYASQADFDEFDMTERQEMLERILSHFNAFLVKVEAQLLKAKRSKRKPLKQIETLKMEREFLVVVIQYFKTYFMITNVDTYSLSEYLVKNLDYLEYNIMKMTRKYVGKASNMSVYNNRDSIIQNRHLVYGLSYEMDDYAPNEYKLRRSRRGMNKNKNGYQKYY
jgi:hypothetical protein